MATGRANVSAPMAAAPRFGLLASIPTEDASQDRWGGGIQYRPEGCVDGYIYDICDAPTRTTPENRDVVAWQPYVLHVSQKCSSFSGEYAENQARIVRLLQSMTETLIGREFWGGELSSTATDTDGDPSPNTWLANVADVDILSELGPVGLVHGLACLEQYLSENNGGQQGAIHATAQVVTHWESFRLLRREGNKILTFKDTVVIPSPGYLGTSPDGNIGNNNIWAYATDMPRIWLGDIKPVEDKETFDRTDNTVVVQAERKALVEWERCRHAGVRLAMEVCDTGGS